MKLEETGLVSRMRCGSMSRVFAFDWNCRRDYFSFVPDRHITYWSVEAMDTYRYFHPSQPVPVAQVGDFPYLYNYPHDLPYHASVSK